MFSSQASNLSQSLNEECWLSEILSLVISLIGKREGTNNDSFLNKLWVSIGTAIFIVS